MYLLELEEQFEKIAEDIGKQTNKRCTHFGMGVFGVIEVSQLGLLKRKVFDLDVHLFITVMSFVPAICCGEYDYLIVNFDFK